MIDFLRRILEFGLSKPPSDISGPDPRMSWTLDDMKAPYRNDPKRTPTLITEAMARKASHK